MFIALLIIANHGISLGAYYKMNEQRNVVDISNEYSAIKKNEIMSFAGKNGWTWRSSWKMK
jgi:hypothetical protein